MWIGRLVLLVLAICIAVATAGPRYASVNVGDKSSDAVAVAAVESAPQSSGGNGGRFSQIDVEHNFLLGIAYTGWLHENNTRCGQELELFLLAVINADLWTLRVLDSFGLRPASFEWGNYFWLGSQQFCDALNDPLAITFSASHPSRWLFNVTAPFALAYSVVHANFSTRHYIDLKLPFQPLVHLGLCLPASCAPQRIHRYTDMYFHSRTFGMQGAYDLQLTAVSSRKPHFDWRLLLRPSSVLFLCIVAFVILLGIAAEYLHRYRKRLYDQQQQHAKASLAGKLDQPECSTMEKLILSFRLDSNVRQAFTVKVSSRSGNDYLGVIAGLRSIICLWVTVFHVYYYSMFALSNAPLVFAKLEQLALQPVMQAMFYVDVFFVISAFLLVSNFLGNERYVQQIRRNNLLANVKLYLKAVLQRYLRLTPVMIVVMLLGDMMFNILNTYTPFYMGPHSAIQCKTLAAIRVGGIHYIITLHTGNLLFDPESEINWWQNLLYIQNLFDMRDICCSWTWYLGCEMQYFIVFTALLFVYAKRPRLGQIVFAAFALVFPVIGWIHNYRHGITFQIDVIHSTLNQLYIKPWIRVNPYIGGMAFGWVFYRFQRQQRKQQQQQQQPQQQSPPPPCEHPASNGAVNKSAAAPTAAAASPSSSPCRRHDDLIAGRWRVAFWCGMAIFYVATNFMSYFRSAPTWLIASIMSFGKLVFALFVGASIVLCSWGHGGWLNRFLASRPFLFLSKFSFSIYMVAPVIVMAMYGLRREATSFTEVGSTSDFLAIILLAVVSSFLLVVLLELPMQRVSNVLLRQRSR